MAAVNLTKLDARMLWVCGHLDGPASGIAEYEGELYWFQLLGNSWTKRRARAYALYPLDEDERKTEMAVHKIYQWLVGRHMDVDINGSRGPERVYASLGNRIYDKLVLPHIQQYRGDRDYTSREPIGYFVGPKKAYPKAGLVTKLVRRVFDRAFGS